jgi:hypothetical protein
LSEGELQGLAAITAGTANALLATFVLAVALSLLPHKLADPLWLLAFTGAPPARKSGAKVACDQNLAGATPAHSTSGTASPPPWPIDRRCRGCSGATI